VSEASLRLIVPCEVRRKELQCNGPLEAGILGLIHDTHAAFAELLEDLVVGNGGTDEERHWGNLLIHRC